MLLKLAVVLFVLATCSAQEKRGWLESPYDNRDFNVRAEYGDDLILLCNDSRIDGANFTVTKWIRPDLEVMYPGDSETFFSLDGEAGWEVSDDGMEMNITILQDKHFGIYYCVTSVEDEPREIVVKIGLNMWGPSFGDVWPKYKDATIWASSLTLAFTICSIVGFVVYTKNEEPEIWFEEDDRPRSRLSTRQSLSHHYHEKKEKQDEKPMTYENKAFNKDDSDAAFTSL